MKRKLSFLSVILCNYVSIMCHPYTVHASSVPSYVEIPEEGDCAIGEENDIAQEDGNLKLGTDFYVYIQNQQTSVDSVVEPEVPAGTLDSFPKTGDCGLNKNGFLFAALFFGTGYLFCDGCERQNEKKI